MLLQNHTQEKPCRLGPAEAFSDELAPERLYRRLHPADAAPRRGRRSPAVARVFASRCAGYPNPPTASEMYDAMRAGEPDPRQIEVIGAWLINATTNEEWEAWVEHAYSWRILVKAMHRLGLPLYRRIRQVNMYAENHDLVPQDAYLRELGRQ